jgi:hypothetical protein
MVATFCRHLHHKGNTMIWLLGCVILIHQALRRAHLHAPAIDPRDLPGCLSAHPASVFARPL